MFIFQIENAQIIPKIRFSKEVAEQLEKIDRIIIVACGTAYYAGLVGEYMLEEQFTYE